MSEQSDRAAMLSDIAAAKSELRDAMQSDIAAAKSELRDAMQSDIAAAKSELRDAMQSDIAAAKFELRAEIKREGRRTRRHFNVMVEKVEAAVKIVAEVNAHHSVVLDDHEARLKSIEKRI